MDYSAVSVMFMLEASVSPVSDFVGETISL